MLPHHVMLPVTWCYRSRDATTSRDDTSHVMLPVTWCYQSRDATSHVMLPITWCNQSRDATSHVMLSVTWCNQSRDATSHVMQPVTWCNQSRGSVHRTGSSRHILHTYTPWCLVDTHNHYWIPPRPPTPHPSGGSWPIPLPSLTQTNHVQTLTLLVAQPSPPSSPLPTVP